MRTRITITISADLLTQIDSIIDHRQIRNRSQAIESLLTSVISPTIDTAVILAGGSKYSTSSSTPSPALASIGGVPLIARTLDHLNQFRFRHIIICTNQNQTRLQQVVTQYTPPGLKISYSFESSPLGTGGALKKASSLIPHKPFLLLHADVLTNINLEDFRNYFHHQHKLASVAIKPRPGKITYGKVYLQGNTVVDYQHSETETPISLINTGIYLFDYSCLELLPKTSKFNLEKTLLPALIKQQQITGFTFQGIWYDITNPQDRQEANTRWPESDSKIQP